MRQGKNTETLAVGCGAGFSGDRVDAPGPVVRTLIERGGAAAIIFEMLAERTLALAQLARKANSELVCARTPIRVRLRLLKRSRRARRSSSPAARPIHR